MNLIIKYINLISFPIRFNNQIQVPVIKYVISELNLTFIFLIVFNMYSIELMVLVLKL